MLKYLIITMDPQKKVFKHLENGKNVLFDIDWQGTDQIKNDLKFKLITFLFYHPQKNIIK